MTTATQTKIVLTGEQVKQIQAAGKNINKKESDMTIKFQDSQVIITDKYNTIIFNFVDMEVSDPFSIYILEFNSLKVTKKDNITITIEDNDYATITINNVRKLVYIQKIDKYHTPTLINPKHITVKNNYIQSLYEAITYTFKSDMRPVLQNIYHNNNSIIVTDSHRLFKKENIFDYEGSFQVYPTTAKLVYQLFNKSTVRVFIDQDGKLIKYQSNNVNVISELSDLNYPDIKRILPESFKTELTVSKNELIEVLSQAKKNAITKFEITENHIEIRIFENDTTALQSQIAAKITGDFVRISFNTQYVLEALKQLKDNTITIRFNGSVSPFTLTDSENYHLVLPVRTN